MSRQWRFIEDFTLQGARWRWECLEADGRAGRKSSRFESYGEAVRDAIAHDFRPTNDRWVIDSAHLVTRHERGQESTVSAKTSGERPTRPRKRPFPPAG